ncbi:hypothetical protein AWR38_13120 [Idiomarina sp. WRN-38]|uniref:ribosome biogenesis factor YjgA n=1 Tax=unclassified Idiomarina TaxID=2614829 RepID=UPI0007335EA7|nr:MULTISPECIES: ribosome biogenesis factor YjgA [unclassified Idiomarina]KTG28505.1 hypothetical protein AUR68_13105 [Idiomarina sp. H105]MCH2455893.1 ribosome-associated protein [Idiomarina sp.]OAF08033.1 hypothetical protein AWR38_13120 [Idiomarina sp. WRN-38]WPZ01710.1 ribosome biogenesis factor YjgA [Idiomarina sp. OXR-189]|tara:strand:- start:38037 stop:38570 length:534 start_codon:yes stop_codon:yes gene_type:complete
MSKRKSQKPSSDVDAHDNDDFVSKSQKKREMAERQKVGTDLVELSDAQLKSMPLDDELRDAVLLARKIRNKHEGYRRQLQFIGKLMRSRDIEPIEQALSDLRNAHQQETTKFHAVEDARDSLLNGGDEALQSFIENYPQADRQKIRQLMRLAEQQKAQEKPPKAARELFVYLRSVIL